MSVLKTGLVGLLLLACLPGRAIAGPDLVVEDIWFDTNIIFQDIVRTRIRNVGDEDISTPLFNGVDIQFFVNGALCSTDEISDLDAGQSTEEDSSPSCFPSGPGPHELRVVADINDEVAEDDETNNELTVIIDARPDLVVTDIALSPPNPNPGEGTITATFENIGGVDTDTLLNIDLTFFLDGQQCATGLLLAGLNAGSTATDSTGACAPTTPGPHTIRVEIDTTFEVDEIDETNNFLETTFIWGDPCAVQELCDGQDNDCDGLTDEGYEAVGTACDSPNDADLCKGGTWVCGADLKSIECSGDTPSGAETCNGVDDDCDGFVDEDFPLGDSCNNGCGTYGCSTDGNDVVCIDDPTLVEACDGLDNDCDGATDEDFTDLGDACTFVAVDGCEAPGTRVCTASGAGTYCVNAATDDNEVCNGEDDDCDGIADDPYEDDGLGDDCSAGVGACRVDGVIACNVQGDGVECDAVAGTPAAEDICDNLIDDNCDGTVDEGCACAAGATQACDGVGCQFGGTQECLDGTWGDCECNPDPGPDGSDAEGGAETVEATPDDGPGAEAVEGVEAVEGAEVGGDLGADVGVSPLADPEGCDCQAGGDAPVGGAVLLVALLGVWWRRRHSGAEPTNLS